MPKKAATFDLSLPMRNSGVTAHRWLYTVLRTDILEGRLRPGSRIPSTRDIARRYGLSRGTVVNAFDQLEAEGYVEGTVGSGTYVSKIRPDDLLHVVADEASKARTQPELPSRVSEYGKRVRLFSGYEMRPVRAFRPNLPALNLFPIARWAKITARCLRRTSTQLLMGCDSLGHLPLRRAVAEYLNTSRGVKCVPEQIAIVSGVQEGLDLTARLCLDPGDRVCMENPGYSGAAMVFVASGAKISGIASDEEGLNVSRLPARVARMVYITPGHQFPLGTTMSLARRLQLLEWARESGALIFEDDYDSEYRYSGHPIPALQGLDRSGSVMYAGSFSTVLFPSLRLGYLVIPSHWVDRFQAAKSITSRHAPMLEQVVLCDFITEGHFGRHIRRMREVYAERLSALLHFARQRLTGLLDISSVEAGLQTSGWLCNGLDGETAAAAAAVRNVDVTPLSRYHRGGAGREGLQLGFAAVDTKEIRRGVQELAIALERLGPARRPRDGRPRRVLPDRN
jgi:GntR family transcriptional regulator/MocR family aminotransferase